MKNIPQFKKKNECYVSPQKDSDCKTFPVLRFQIQYSCHCGLCSYSKILQPSKLETLLPKPLSIKNNQPTPSRKASLTLDPSSVPSNHEDSRQTRWPRTDAMRSKSRKRRGSLATSGFQFLSLDSSRAQGRSIRQI